MKPRRAVSRKLSLSEAAREFHVTRETVKRRLTAAEVEMKPGKWSIHTLHTALIGDLAEERIRKTRAEADILELDRSQRQKDLITMAEAEDVVRSYLLPVRDLILSAPSALSARVNPSDPELARLQLEEWVEDGLRHVRESNSK